MAQRFVDSLTLSWRLSSLTSTLQTVASRGTYHGIKTIPSSAWFKDYDVSRFVGQSVHPNNYLVIITGMNFVMDIHGPHRIIPNVSPDLSRPSSATIGSKCSLETLFRYKVSKNYLVLDFQKSSNCLL